MLTVYFTNSTIYAHCNINEVDNYLDYFDSTSSIYEDKITGFKYEAED